MGDIVLEKMAKEHDFINKVYTGSKNASKKVVSSSEKAKKSDLKKFSAKELGGLFQEIYDHWLEMNKWGEIPNLADFDHFKLTNKIMAFLEESIERSNLDISSGEAYGVLASATERSIMQESEIGLFGILAKIQQNKNAEDLFKMKDVDGIISGLGTFPAIKKEIENHVEKYDWMQYHYDGPTILDEKYFIELLASSVRQKISGLQKIKEIEDHEKDLTKRIAELEKQLNLTGDEKYWCSIARVLSYLKGLRKDTVFIGSRNTDGLIREIGRRLKLSPRQVRHLLLPEIKLALEKGEADADLLNERIVHCITFVDNSGLRIFSGKDAEKYAKMIYEDEPTAGMKEIKGTPAYPGHAIGIIKFVAKAEDMKKMNQGDILLSPATNPNIVPAMKKAAAIITDEGGVTCHAAIVSRELKIPCVIGTKIATKVLKDGDKVEVDAKKGIIRKI
jgi:phosphohistidine swiveling domain-containing protein